MTTISPKKSKSKLEKKAEKKARQIQRQIQKKNKTKCLGKTLTAKQKEIRSQKIADRKAFKEKRRQLRIEEKETRETQQIEKVFSQIFNTNTLDLLAKSTGFIKRKGEITAFAFVYIISFGHFGNGEIALTYLVAGLSKHFAIFVTPQALSKRINSSSAPNFLKTVLERLLGAQIEKGLKNQMSKCFSMFDGVYIQDSTQVALNEHLSDDFEGQGGGASKSALKIDFVYDITNYIVSSIKMTSATVNDQTNCKEILKCIKSKSLVIRDLGYFTIDCLKKIQKKGCYYLSRLTISANVYLDKDGIVPLDLVKYFKMHLNENNDTLNVKVYVGKEERMETRLIVQKVPASVAAKRARRHKNERKKEPSPFYTEWCKYSIFITNIPESMFSTNLIIALYKIRWQIEIVFKSLKTNVEIDYMKGTNKNRIKSLVYGRLITLVATFIIQNYVANIAEDREVSGDKLIKWLMSDNRLRDAIIQNNLTMLLISLVYEVFLLCKQQRNRKTTLEEIIEAMGNPSSQPFTASASEGILEDEIFKDLFYEAM